MAFEIEVTEPARDDIDEAYRYIADRASEAAGRWIRELWDLIFSLDEMPARYAEIPEADSLKLPYRSALHHSHRVIFRIDERSNIVYVVRVYHGARKPLTSSDLD